MSILKARLITWNAANTCDRVLENELVSGVVGTRYLFLVQMQVLYSERYLLPRYHLPIYSGEQLS